MASRLAPVTLAHSLRKIYRVAGILAPTRDWDWLQKICRRLEAAARPVDKGPRVVEAEEVSRLGHALMEQAEAETQMPAFSRARLYRDGLIIGLLSATLLRRRNLAGLRIGVSLVRTGRAWRIAIPARESKNGDPIDLPLPTELGMRVDRYLDHYRPAFRGHEDHDAVWLSRNGRPLTSNQLYTAVVSHTQAAFGKAVSPHLMRACAATSTARHDGAHVRLAAAALGHRHPRTTEKYYNQNTMIDAVRRYQIHVFGSDATGERP